MLGVIAVNAGMQLLHYGGTQSCSVLQVALNASHQPLRKAHFFYDSVGSSVVECEKMCR